MRDQVNNVFNTATAMELLTLNPRSLPQDLTSINYNGILSRSLFVEARGSVRRFTFKGDGAPTTDLIKGTQITDRQRGGTYYWSPTFCGVCDPTKRNNQEFFVKGSYFLSSQGIGSHDMAFGYDNFDDRVFSNNHQSGSDWIINGTTSIVQGTKIFPQFLGDGSTFINYRPTELWPRRVLRFANAIGKAVRSAIQLSFEKEALLRDTELKTAALIALKDEAKVRAERENLDKSKFLADAAHDLRQPMQQRNPARRLCG